MPHLCSTRTGGGHTAPPAGKISRSDPHVGARGSGSGSSHTPDKKTIPGPSSGERKGDEGREDRSLWKVGRKHRATAGQVPECSLQKEFLHVQEDHSLQGALRERCIHVGPRKDRRGGNTRRKGDGGLRFLSASIHVPQVHDRAYGRQDVVLRAGELHIPLGHTRGRLSKGDTGKDRGASEPRRTTRERRGTGQVLHLRALPVPSPE